MSFKFIKAFAFLIVSRNRSYFVKGDLIRQVLISFLDIVTVVSFKAN